MTAPPAEALTANTLAAGDAEAAEAAAGWIEDQIDRGAPPKWVAAQASAALRWIASWARVRPGTGRLTAAAAEAAADWAEDQIAGGVPAKQVVAKAAASLRWIAAQDRAGWPEEDTP